MEPKPFRLRSFQTQALDALARGVPHLAVSAPTGSGKSLIYEMAARRFARRSVLVTPLQALGVQQVSRLLNAPREMRTLKVSLGLAVHAREHRLPPRVGHGESGIWTISPEMLQSPLWLDHLRSYRPDLWIIDEAHCVWEWGDRFRPAYSELLRKLRMREVPLERTLWLSATFPPRGLEELRASFGAELEIQGSFNLPLNLRLIWEHVEDAERIGRLLHWVTLLSRAPGVIFVSSRNAAVRIGRLLTAASVDHVLYHAGLPPEVRRAVEGQLFQGQTRARVIVATSAFGLGMDLDYLRWGVFWDLPYGVLDLAQRIGRVGRQGKEPATLVVLWQARLLQTRADPALTRVIETEQCRRLSFAQEFATTEISWEPRQAAPAQDCCDYCLRKFSPSVPGD